MTTAHRQAALPHTTPARSPAPLVPRLEYFNAHHSESRSGRIARHLRHTVQFIAGIAGVVGVLLAAYLIRNLTPGREVNWSWLGQSVRDCVVFGSFSAVLFAIATGCGASPEKSGRRRLPLAALAGAGQALLAAACIRANDLFDVPDNIVMIVTLLLVLVYPVLVALLVGRLAREPRHRGGANQEID